MKELLRIKNCEFKNIELKNYSSYKVGGKSIIAYPHDVNSLVELLKYVNSNDTQYKIIGNITNLIFKDDGYDGILINLSKIKKLKKYGDYITVSSGYNIALLSNKMCELGYSGLEFASAIPGTVGGAIYMNAGAYGSDVSKCLYKLKILTEDYKIKTLYRKNLYFDYRESFLKNTNYICLEATFKLCKGNKEELVNKIKEWGQKRRVSQPLEYPNAGSVFKNPIPLYAGKLIEDAGLKGKNVGGAYVSLKHANFIINKNNATSKDIIDLINLIKKEIKKKYDIDLICEQEIV